MSKLKSKKNKHMMKSHLTADQKQFGKQQIYILIGMIVVSLAIALYYMQ